jgi:uncharacterized damage-inducible protein DinB
MMAKALLITSFELSQRMLAANLDGISHEESMLLPGNGGNPINWIAGHILASRNSILKLAGGDVYLDSEGIAPYARGSKRLQPGDKCMTIEQIKEGLSETSKQTVKLLRALPDGALEQEIEIPGFPVKFDEPTLDAHLSLLLYHEGYHNGQLGLARCVIGKEPQLK